MSGKIRIGILGCAGIARRSIIPAIKNLPSEFDLVAIASRSIDKAALFAHEFSCEPVVGYENLVTSGKIDALYIPLPTGLHKEWINKALLAGKHVYAEKSIAFSYDDSLEMVKNALKSNKALMEGYMFQYHSQHQHVFRLLKSGVIGEIRHFSASFGFPPLPENNFRYDERIGGGAIMDAAGYTVRAAFFILGNELEIKGASVYYNSSGTSIFGSAYLQGNNGVGASLSFGFDNYYQCFYQIWGSSGKITVERAFTPALDYQPPIILETIEGKEQINVPADNHFEKALLEFSRIIKGNDKQKHYDEILIQSEVLEKLKIFSKKQPKQVII